MRLYGSYRLRFRAYFPGIEEVSTISEKFYHIEEINYDAEVEKILIGLGFERSDFTRPTSEFSGGWRMRIELAKILLKNPDLILLDEPTNHLDIESIQWLEEFLMHRQGRYCYIARQGIC